MHKLTITFLHRVDANGILGSGSIILFSEMIGNYGKYEKSMAYW